MACLLALVAVSSGEEWKPLWKDWKAALARYDAAVKQAPNDAVRARIRHPIGKFRARLRAYAIEHSGHREAAPPLIEMLRYTRNADEQLWVMTLLREDHLRSKYLARTVDALVRINSKESLRTLREIGKGSPHKDVASAARRGVHECTLLAIGRPAIGPFSRRYRGSVVILTFGKVAADLSGLGAKTVPIEDEAVLRRWNATERPRLFVLDKQGRIAGKDLARKQLEALLATLK